MASDAIVLSEQLADSLSVSTQLALVRRGRFNLQPAVDNFNTGSGLRETLQWPISPQLEPNMLQYVYRYGMVGTGGTVPTSLAQTIAQMSAFEAACDGWLTARGIPANWKGDIALDIESWQEFENKYDGDPAQTTEFYAAYRGMTWAEGSHYANTRMVARVRALRPQARRIFIDPVGEVNPNFMTWHFGPGEDGGVPDVPDVSDVEGTFQSYIKQAAKAAPRFQSTISQWVPTRHSYTGYWAAQGATRAGRILAQSRAEAIFRTLWGPLIYRRAPVLVSLLHTSPMTGALSKDQLKEILSDLFAMGYRNIHLWGNLVSTADRDLWQSQITNVLAPAIVELGGKVNGFATQAAQA